MGWRRVAIVIFLTLLPWPLVWYGMYHVRSLVLTFVLYHGVCLLPACIWGRRLWLPHLVMPTARQWLLVLAATAASCLAAIAAYNMTGELVVSRTHVLEVMTERGYDAHWLLPLAIYFVIVNAVLEELFWRGVILNELDYLDQRVRFAGTAWTAVAFGAWHYLAFRALLQPGYAELCVLGVIGTGAFCSWVYRRTQSIVMPILWHALVFDLSIIALFVVLVNSIPPG